MRQSGAVSLLDDAPELDAAIVQTLHQISLGTGALSVDSAQRASSAIATGSPMHAVARMSAALAAWQGGSREALHELFEHAVATDESDDLWTAALAWHVTGMAHRDIGAHDVAIRAFGRATSIAESLGADDLALLSRIGEGLVVHPETGELHATAEELSDMRTRAARQRWQRLAVRAGQGEAYSYWVAGDTAAARLRAEGALLHARRLPVDADRASAAALAAWLRIASGDVEGANVVTGTPDEWFASGTSPTWGWKVARAALAAGGQAMDNDRCAQWHAALRMLHAAGAVPVEAVRAEADAWRALARGDAAEANSIAERARDLWSVAGQPHEAARLTVLMQTNTDPFRHHAQLTPRERQVAQLLTARMTNIEIADHLQVSVRTAEHHVANVLRKLGLHSRRDLVDFVR